MSEPTSSARRLFLGTAAASCAAALVVDGSLPDKTAEAAQVPDASGGIEAIRNLFKSKDPVTWIITGDSITHGALHTKGWRSYPEHFAERVRWELARVRDIVINTGISGERTGGLLADFDWRAARFQPRVVSIMLGMNDCAQGEAGRETFRKNLTQLVERSHMAGALPLLHVPNPIYVKNAASRADLPAYAEIVREVAAATRSGLVDHWKFWTEQKPDQESLLPWLEDKSIHPGVLGHRAFARLMFQELGIYDEKSPTCRLSLDTP